MVDHDFVEGSLVVSLNAPFGAGKTYFLSMWKSDLDKRREGDSALPTAIILNAWESDYCGDPLLSIVNALVKAVGDDKSTDNSEACDRLREAAKDVGWFVTGLANNLVSHWMGFDPVSAGELAEDKKGGRKAKIPDFVALYEERTKSLQRLKDTLREVFGGDRLKAFLFVDELDRCRPDYAISYLETIKHVFDVHGLAFVLAVDCKQLECSAKALFGTDLEFPDYFRKFVQRTITLPAPDKSGLQNLAFHYVRYYLEREDKRTSLMPVKKAYWVESIVELISALNMTPRQIQETFRIIGHTLATDDPKRKDRFRWCIGAGVVLMSALKVAAPRMYRVIGRGEITHPEVGKYLIGLLGKEKAYWWFRVYVTGADSRDYKDEESLERLFRELGFVGTDILFNTQNELGQFIQGWGYSLADGCKQIYQNIETATVF